MAMMAQAMVLKNTLDQVLSIPSLKPSRQSFQIDPRTEMEAASELKLGILSAMAFVSDVESR
jgi:hypothetical protein